MSTVAFPFAAFVQPGLYMVSVNVNASYSFEEFDAWFDRPNVGIPRPYLINLTAGAATQSTLSTTYPEVISFGYGAPKGYFWTDFLFTPTY